jgi:alpha-galactosidase
MPRRAPGILAVLATVAALQTGCSTPTAPAPQPLTTPPMGWNSWNSGIELTEQNVKETIDAMVSSGMRDAGYRYVNLDAGWAAPQRTEGGALQADPASFPDGMAAVATYAHERGMRLGLYASPFEQGCSAQLPLASAGHETQDARTFAGWGVDFLKYDWCRGEADHDHQVRVFTAMRDALRATGRRIVYSINPNSSADATAGVHYDWSGVADMARATTDLVPVWRDGLTGLGSLDPIRSPTYRGVADEFAVAATAIAPSRPRFAVDPDMLTAGVTWAEYLAAHFATGPGPYSDGAGGLVSGSELSQKWLAQTDLTPAEKRTHLSLWAMLSAPLIAGNDVRSMTSQTRDILTNREVIAVDQDSRSAAPKPVNGDDRVLVKPLADGAVAVALYNPTDAPAVIDTTAGDLGLDAASCYRTRDLWKHTEASTVGDIGAADLAPHAVALLRVTPCR